jgi:NodT family efflux transporter outer membrane factor (OMF) lipoprotein
MILHRIRGVSLDRNHGNSVSETRNQRALLFFSTTLLLILSGCAMPTRPDPAPPAAASDLFAAIDQEPSYVFGPARSAANPASIESDSQSDDPNDDRNDDQRDDQNDDPASDGMDRRATERVAWWRRLGGAELDALVDRLLDQSLTLEAASARVAQASALIRSARSQRLPAVTASVDGGQQRGNAFLPGQGATTPEWTTIYRSSLNASWDFDLFGAARSAEQAAALRAESARLAALDLSQALIAELTKAYVNAWALRERLAINRSLASSFEQTAELTDARLRAGSPSARLLDVQIARQNAAAAAASVPELERQLRNQLSAIEVLLGARPGTLRFQFDAVSMATGLTDPPLGPPADLLVARSDVALAELDWAAAQFDVRAAQRRRLPTLDLSLSFSHQSDDLDDLLDIDQWVGTVLAGLFAPLYQGGRLTAELAQAEAAAAERAATYAEAALAALADVERALTDRRYTAEQLARRETSLTAAERSDELAELRYSAGTISLLTLLETRRSLDSARQDRVRAEQAAMNAWIDLQRALGGPWFQADPAPANASPPPLARAQVTRPIPTP